MKTAQNTTNSQNKQGSHIHKPEIRDNLDSRKNQEQERKGEHTTHNKKDHKND